MIGLLNCPITNGPIIIPIISWKIEVFSTNQNRGNCDFFFINIKKVSQKDLVRAAEISTARAICNLYSCYKKKHLFSANQKCVIFFMFIIALRTYPF